MQTNITIIFIYTENLIFKAMYDMYELKKQTSAIALEAIL